MDIVAPNSFKDLSVTGIKELILKHNYTITSYVKIKANKCYIILVLIKGRDNLNVDLLSSYKTDLVLNNIDKKLIAKWLPYQNRLKTVVKLLTNYTYERVLKFNLMDYFSEYLNLTNDNLTNDIIKRASELSKIFKEEALFATNRYKNKILRLKDKDDSIYKKELICQMCGGRCCLDGSCDYLVSDFKEISIPYIKELLDSGIASIKSVFYKSKEENKLNLLLILKARNINGGKIDLISIDSKCSLLSDKGCTLSYEQRPGFAKHLIPNNLFKCFNDLNVNLEETKWMEYQDVLEKILYLETGRTKDEEFRSEITLFFRNVLEENFEGITENSIKEAKSLFDYLKDYYKKEYDEVVSLLKPNMRMSLKRKVTY